MKAEKDPEAKVYYKNVENNREEYDQMTLDLAKDLKYLVDGLAPNQIEIRNDGDRLPGHPKFRLYSYDTLGFIATDQRYHQIEMNWAVGSVTIKAFPSTQGKPLTDRLDEIMVKRGFDEIKPPGPEYMTGIGYI